MSDEHFRDPNYWRARAKEARTKADEVNDVVAKAQIADRADEFDVKAKRAAEASTQSSEASDASSTVTSLSKDLPAVDGA